jgi:2,4-dienoyl-CoA reductase-like NADH-dependent reductase (Old Yellow Enzyme family)
MIRRKIERYLRQSGMSATEFGRQVARDPRLVHDIRRGRELGTRLVERIDTFIAGDA